MKEELLNKIKSRGFWRINYQPFTDEERIISLQKCRDIVIKNSIQLRGWDYPHIPDQNKILFYGNYVESEEDWKGYKEFWRMYKSGQFLCYRSLRDDWYEESIWNDSIKKIPPMKLLGIISSVIYEITEYFLFVSRLANDGLYKEGATINISLHNTAGRKLWVEDQRIPFFNEKINYAKDLVFSEQYTNYDLLNDYKNISNKLILKIFDGFGWNPSPDMIFNDQNTLLSGKIFH